MAQRRHHYERAFESYLRARRVPYIAVDEARKALFQEPGPALPSRLRADHQNTTHALKSFDFVIYGQGMNYLADVKGRRIPMGLSSASRGRLESWVTQDDLDSLDRWQQLFGPGFRAVFVFLYWCQSQPPDALFQEIFEDHGRWYAIRSLTTDEYRASARVRSPRWRTVHLSTEEFERLSQPLLPGMTASGRIFTSASAAPIV